jgi:hypothetical protein
MVTSFYKSWTAKGFPIHAALWYDDSERMGWKLIIVSTVAGRPGPLEAYMRIRHALAKLKGMGLSMDDILVMSPESRAFQDLRITIEGVSQVAAPGQPVSLEGIAFEGAYVYRWPAN